MSASCPIYAFELRLRLVPDLDAHARAALRAAFHDMLDAEGLSATEERDGDEASWWSYAITRDGSQATHADRELLADWAARRAEIAECRVGPLVDRSRVA